MNIADKLLEDNLLPFVIGSLISSDSNITKEEIENNLSSLKSIKEKIETSDIKDKVKWIETCDTGIEILEKDLEEYK